jgi:hypothetical protein
MSDIFEFCYKRIEEDRTYRCKHFRERLLQLAEMKSEFRSTKPGQFSDDVSEANTSETAFQRAIYNHTKTSLVGGGHVTPLIWLDGELPIILSNKSRRRCVDLIGRTEITGTFLCELKYAKIETVPRGNDADYAIFEALLYYAIVNRDHGLLDRARVYHPPAPPRFSWSAVSESRVIVVLANDRFWTTANRKRILTLVEEIDTSLSIQMLLCSTPNHLFRPRGVTGGKYKPKLAPCADEISADGKSFPYYRLVATFD